MSDTTTDLNPITRTADNGHLDQIPGVGAHEPAWYGEECPSCGSAPCGPHPDVLACKECEEDWPCPHAQGAIDELERVRDELERAVEVPASVAELARRARELRGEVSR